MRPFRFGTIVALIGSIFALSPAAAQIVPQDFAIENAYSGVGFNNPVGLAFTPDGRMLVAEKRGAVRVVRNGVKLPIHFWNGEAEILSNGDRGLLGLAVDPGFATNHYVYFLYTVDPDSNGTDNNDDSFGRLVRYQTSTIDTNVVDPMSRTVLIGATWSEGFPSGGPSHAIGALRFGRDGSLFVSWGDGAQYTVADAGGRDSLLFLPGRIDPDQDIGAFRAQHLGSLSGKILRVNPGTGEGYDSNPYFDGDPRSNRSRVWVYGCRNPFRFAVRPGTGDTDPSEGDPGVLYIGDVGWGRADEVDVSPRGGENFGWPCEEGTGPLPPYQEANPAHHGCASIGTEENPTPTSWPTIVTNHDDTNWSVPIGLAGNCIIGGVFYEGSGYPEVYRDRYFFADFGYGWIKTARLDEDQELEELTDFAEEVEGPVDFAIDPVTEEICFVGVYVGTVFRIRYTGPVQGNNAPVAAAAAIPAQGTVPLVVDFASAGSTDPDLDPLAFHWNFGDGQAAIVPSPEHIYEQPGRYDAVLTVSDGRGGVARDTVVIWAFGATGFPSAPVVDDFNRPDGPLGGTWTGNTSGLRILDNAMVQTSATSYAIWNGVTFGADQEVHATFEALTEDAEHDLLLKVQGPSWQDGHVQVHYDTELGGSIILTYASTTGWVRVGGPYAMQLDPGDCFGGRAFANGIVEVYKNSQLIGTATVGAWPFAASGGRLGVLLNGATETRMSEFGGGNIVTGANGRPRATVLAPGALSFYTEDEIVHLEGAGWDAEEPASSLHYRWEVDLHHNNHIHPVVFAADAETTSFVAENHSDGTGTWLRARFIVSDGLEMSDTTAVDLHPEVDLEPSVIATFPYQPGTEDPTEYRFVIQNHGRMPAPSFHWRLIAGNRLLAEGDTLVEAQSSVMVSTIVPPVLAPGTHVLRVVVDTTSAIVETSEANNAQTRSVTVVAGWGLVDVDPAAGRLALSNAYPNPSRGAVALALELPRVEAVEFSVFDVQGREVWHGPDRTYAPGLWSLRWDGRTRDGAAARTGLYMARVMVGGVEFRRRVAVLR